jgi:hypothetical protein
MIDAGIPYTKIMEEFDISRGSITGIKRKREQIDNTFDSNLPLRDMIDKIENYLVDKQPSLLGILSDLKDQFISYVNSNSVKQTTILSYFKPLNTVIFPLM